jgi:capsular exopolysaccharide synthesis family protein
LEIKVYLDFLRRRWYLLLLGPLIAGLAAHYVTQQLTPVYRASATMLVNRTTTPGVIEYSDILTSERLTNTYAQLVTRPSVLDEVKKRLALTLPNNELEAKLAVAPVAETQLFQVAANDPDPGFAALLANTTAQAFVDDNASQLTPTGFVSIARPAEVPTTPISPKPMFNIALAVVVGLMLAGGLGLLLDYLDDTIKTNEDVEAVAELPTLAQIGRFRAKTGPAFATELHSRTAEAYRQLRTNVHFTGLGRQLKTIVVTSAHPEEGKSTTAANLATVLAQAGSRVILVDTDLRRSSLNKTFDGPNSFGLTGLLLNDIHDPSIALIGTRWKNLQLLPSGVLPPNPSELLTSTRMQRLVGMLRGLADYVIFDTPPVLAVTDAIVLAARADGTVLVAEAGKTRSEALRIAARTLKQANVNVIGVVLNKAKVSMSGAYYYRSTRDEGVEIQPDAADSAFIEAVAPVVAAPRQEATATIPEAPVPVIALPISEPALVVAAVSPGPEAPAPVNPAPPSAAPMPLVAALNAEAERLAKQPPVEPLLTRRHAPALPLQTPRPTTQPATRDLTESLETRLQALTARDQELREAAAARLAMAPVTRGIARGHANGNGHVLEIAARDTSNGHAPANGNGHNGNGHVVTNGNGHASSTSNGHGGNGQVVTNGNGHAAAPAWRSAQSPEADHLSSAMSELMSHLDETVGLIRSMRPSKEGHL